ncbi:hypothetical protein JCM1393_25360 [Clostridium carnis]
MRLWEYVGKEIEVICVEGEIIKGKCTDFTQALDNEPEVDSIGVEVGNLSYELYQNEIESIKEV